MVDERKRKKKMATLKEQKKKQAEEDSKKLTTKEKKKLRNEITHKLRFEILERDQHRCKRCGASPKTDPTVELVIDHIVPLSAGGTNDLTNLETLCHSCNEGKKDTVIQKKVDKLVVNPVEFYQIQTEGEIQSFFLSPSNEEARQWLFTTHEKNGTDCPRDCGLCVTKKQFYNHCFNMLTRELKSQGGSQTIEVRKIEANPLLQDDLIVCNTCYLAGRCPKFVVNQSCVFNFSLDTDFSDTKTGMRVLVNIQKERVMRAVLNEKIDGGVLDKNLTNEISVLSQLMFNVENLNSDNTQSIEIKATGSKGTGILATLFGDLLQGRSALAPVAVQQLPAAEVVNPVSEVLNMAKVPSKS